MNNNFKYLCSAAMIAAVYTVLSLLFAPISFGPIQCRISEMLVILPAFIPAAIPGVTIGCLLTNILGGGVIADIIFGTLATFIGAVLTAYLAKPMLDDAVSSRRPSLKFRLFAVLPPILSNTIIVPFVLKYAYGYGDAIWFMFITIGIGEIIAIGIVGNLFMTVICRTKLITILKKDNLI